jgi:ribosomal protein S18 acetylase RimI-like enzyme
VFTLIIRQATEADVPVLCELHQQWFEEGEFYGFVQSQAQIEAALGPYFLVAEVDGEIVGFIYGEVAASSAENVIPKNEDYLEIDSLYLIPSCRHQGIGSRLLDELMARAKQGGVTYAALYSSNKNIRSILSFYEKHGFQSWYIRMFQKL